MPVMMTSSADCCRWRWGRAALSRLFPLVDTRPLRFPLWLLRRPGLLRGTISTIVALKASPRRGPGLGGFQLASAPTFVSELVGQVSYGAMKKFEELTEREVLALAISLEEEDERVYADFAEGLRPDYPASAAMFEGMREEESGHRRRLIELYRQKFGEHIPLVRRHDVPGFVERPALWLIRPMRIVPRP